MAINEMNDYTRESPFPDRFIERGPQGKFALMILHIVLFKWKEGTTKAQVDALEAAMSQLPAAIPGLKALQLGADMKFREGNADWALAALFENQEDWQAYQVHPAHQAVVKEHAGPIMASRNAIQMPAPAGWKF